jgi:hypothetical protein
MPFGLQLNSQHPATEKMRSRLEELLEHVRLAQAIGCHSIVIIPDVTLTTRPVQRPRPPIWMEADHDPALTSAARLVGLWSINPHAQLDTLEHQMVLCRDAVAELGKPLPQEVPSAENYLSRKIARQRTDWYASRTDLGRDHAVRRAHHSATPRCVTARCT